MPIPFLFQQQTGLAKVLNGSQFYAPRTSSITQTRGSGTPTETRATVATVTNNDGYQVTALSGEIRQQGARRVRNLLKSGNSDACSGGTWANVVSGAASITLTAGQADPFGGTSATKVAFSAAAAGEYVIRRNGIGSNQTVGNSYISSIWMKADAPVTMYLNDGSDTYEAISVTTDWVRIPTPVGVAASANTNFDFSPKSAGNNGVTGAINVYVYGSQLEDVTAQTTQTAGEYVSVGVLSAPYHGAGVDGVKYFTTDISGNPIPAATLDGSVVEAAAENLCLQSNAFGTAPWVAAGTPAATQNVIGPDGATSAWTLTDNDPLASEYIYQNDITLTAATYTASIFVKKTTGAQPSYPIIVAYLKAGTTALAAATIDTSNGVATAFTAYTGFTGVNGSATCVSHNDNFWRVALTFTGTAALWRLDIYTAGTTNATQSTGNVDVTAQGSAVFYGAQVELGSYATAYQATTTAAVTRNKDILDDQVSGNLTAAAGSVAFQWTPSHAPSGTIALCGSYVDANNYTALLHDATKYIWRKRIGGVNYDAELTATFASGTTYDIALRLGANGINLAVDGVLGTPHANADPAQLGTRWQWGADGNGGQQAGAAFKEKYLWTRALSDSELQAVTA